MKRFLIAACLAGMISESNAVAAGAFPWFHTRPKPVLLDDQPSATPVAQNRVPYHGTAVYPASGRLYLPVNARAPYDRRTQAPPPVKSRFSDILTRAWHFGESSTGKPASAQTK